MLYFQKRGCDATISNEFQFQEVEIEGEKKIVYEYNTTNNKVLCLGVDPGCEATLKLITKSDGQDGRCYFEKLSPL